MWQVMPPGTVATVPNQFDCGDEFAVSVRRAGEGVGVGVGDGAGVAVGIGAGVGDGDGPGAGLGGVVGAGVAGEPPGGGIPAVTVISRAQVAVSVPLATSTDALNVPGSS